MDAAGRGASRNNAALTWLTLSHCPQSWGGSGRPWERPCQRQLFSTSPTGNPWRLSPTGPLRDAPNLSWSSWGQKVSGGRCTPMQPSLPCPPTPALQTKGNHGVILSGREGSQSNKSPANRHQLALPSCDWTTTTVITKSTSRLPAPLVSRPWRVWHLQPVFMVSLSQHLFIVILFWLLFSH